MGSRQEKVCVMEVMEGSDLAGLTSTTVCVVPSLLRAIHSRSFGVRIGMDLVEVWVRARGGMAGGWGWARETYIARKMCGYEASKSSRVRFYRFIFGSSGFNKDVVSIGLLQNDEIKSNTSISRIVKSTPTSYKKSVIC